MFRQSPSRNQRSKGVKVKPVLQICLLLAVCFWLIYQVKHSHDKRKEFDEHENGGKILEKAKSSIENLKLGRKDLHPQEDKKVIDSEKHEVEVEDLEEEETGGGEEENKHEVEEQEHEGEIKNEEKEDEERGGGDDEIDELDQDKTEGDADHEEDFIDEEREREEESEEKDVEGKGRQTENESSLEDQDHDGSGRNTHEAREEHYKADDASSEVAHDTDTINTEMEKLRMENTSEDNVLEQEHKSNDTEEITDQNDSGSTLEEGQTAENITLNVATGNETILLKSEDSSLLNSTTTNEFNEQPGLNNNSTELTKEKSGAALQNGTETTPDSTQVQNVTVQETIIGEGANNSSSADVGLQSNSNFTISTKLEDADMLTGGYKNSSISTEHSLLESFPTSNGTAEANDSSESLITKENADANQNEKLYSSEETETTDEENSDSSSLYENAESVQHDHGDSSDSILQEERENRIDLDTLPEIITEGSGNEDAAAE